MAGFEVRAIRGDMRKTAKKLQDAGRRRMRTEIRAALTKSTKDLRRKVPDRARATLPSRGGLNRWAAVTPQLVTSFRGDTTEIRLTMRKPGHDVKSLDEGRVRHKTFGHGPWSAQTVQGGFFKDTVREEGEEIQRTVREALSRYLQSLND